MKTKAWFFSCFGCASSADLAATDKLPSQISEDFESCKQQHAVCVKSRGLQTSDFDEQQHPAEITLEEPLNNETVSTKSKDLVEHVTKEEIDNCMKQGRESGCSSIVTEENDPKLPLSPEFQNEASDIYVEEKAQHCSLTGKIEPLKGRPLVGTNYRIVSPQPATWFDDPVTETEVSERIVETLSSVGKVASVKQSFRAAQTAVAELGVNEGSSNSGFPSHLFSKSETKKDVLYEGFSISRHGGEKALSCHPILLRTMSYLSSVVSEASDNDSLNASDIE